MSDERTYTVTLTEEERDGYLDALFTLTDHVSTPRQWFAAAQKIDALARKLRDAEPDGKEEE